MKTQILVVASLAVLALGACKKELGQNADRPLNASVITLANGGTLPRVVGPGDTLVLPACGSYVLNGKCYIDSLAGIRIGAGATIRGVRKTTADSASAIIVCRGGYINAQGTEASPITFTGTAGDEIPGAWGGIVLLGQSTVNKTNPVIEGVNLPSLPTGINVSYGGSIPADSSGIITYAKILYAGASVSANNELNGLTLGGVGSRTKLEHIYVAFGADDGFEFFGGTVNAKWLISRSSNDDQFDFDFGYTGNIQYALAYLDPTIPGVTTPYNSDANGIESDNDGTGSGDLPLTNPHISNLTIVGGSGAAVTGSLYGSRWRRNTNATIENAVVMGYNPSVFFGTPPPNNVVFCNSLIHTFSALPATFNVCNNSIYTTGATSNDSIRLVRPFGTTCGNIFNQIDFRPNATTSPARSGAVWNWSPSGFFQQVTYRGAFDPAGTARQWTAFICSSGCN